MTQIKAGFKWKAPLTMTDLEPYTLSVKLGTDYKNSEASIGPVLAALYEEENGVYPKPNTRLRYVVYYRPKAKYFQRVVLLSTFQREQYSLDFEYYLETQLGKAIDQILDLYPSVRLQLTKSLKAYSYQLYLQKNNIQQLSFKKQK